MFFLPLRTNPEKHVNTIKNRSTVHKERKNGINQMKKRINDTYLTHDEQHIPGNHNRTHNEPHDDG